MPDHALSSHFLNKINESPDFPRGKCPLPPGISLHIFPSQDLNAYTTQFQDIAASGHAHQKEGTKTTGQQSVQEKSFFKDRCLRGIHKISIYFSIFLPSLLHFLYLKVSPSSSGTDLPGRKAVQPYDPEKELSQILPAVSWWGQVLGP